MARAASGDRLTGRAALGALSEALVAWVLATRGRIVEGRGVRIAGVQVDLLTRQGGVLALVEVKARFRGDDDVPASLLVSRRQRLRLLRAAEALAAERGAVVRIDLAEVRWRPWPDVQVHENALADVAPGPLSWAERGEIF